MLLNFDFGVNGHKLKILHADLLNTRVCFEEICRGEVACKEAAIRGIESDERKFSLTEKYQLRAEKDCAEIRLKMKANFSRENKVCEQLEEMLIKLDDEAKAERKRSQTNPSYE